MHFSFGYYETSPCVKNYLVSQDWAVSALGWVPDVAHGAHNCPAAPDEVILNTPPILLASRW